ncbi:proto-oncogene tyrosine-protein kinase receptor Ret-like isoform X2 [Oculina patagonica]
MILPGIFLSWLIVFVSSETEILVNEPLDEGLWHWNIKTYSQGAGWIHPSTVKERYKVCDISDRITKEPKNWLQTDFIDVRNATRLDIEVHYSLLNCPTNVSSQYCKTYLTLYSYHADTKNSIPDPTKGVFQKETVITPPTLPKPGELVQDIFRGSVVTKAKGIYLAFLDKGVCMTLTKVVISYRYCTETGITLVTFPRTVAPANDSYLIEQIGKCTDVNSINKVKLSGVCLSNGKWNITDDLVCLCKAGYQLVNGTIAPLECRETKNATSIYLKIIYGFAGLLAVLVTSVVFYIVCKRWAHRKKAREKKVPTASGSEIRVYEDIPMLPEAEDQNNDDNILDSFELDRDQITVVRLLGTGNFGQVSKANYGRLVVAVKSLKENAQPKDTQDMLSELDVMKPLHPHPHVVRLIGCCTKKDPLLIVLEYLPYGDLLGYLRKSRGIEDTYNTGEKRPNSRLSEKDLLSFAWMIADGMNYLAAMKVVHRDLAARNVLVGENKVCKISDFGLARELEGDVYTRRTQARLPAKWMPPESLFYGESSSMSDIWSYGIVMWEVFTIGESPYPGFKHREVAGLLQTGYRMPRPRHISEELYSIMSECWEEQPHKRPTFQWLCSAVRRLLDDKQMYVNLGEYDDQDYVNFDMINDQE